LAIMLRCPFVIGGRHGVTFSVGLSCAHDFLQANAGYR
jgi:hypothetical protein